jgi:type II secretory pathway pseudopilin PulG
VTIGSEDRGQPEFAPPGPPARGRSAVFSIAIALAAVFVVGIGVLGIAAARLMPAALEAKTRSDESICRNNLKQIGLAAIQYADDNHFFPNVPSDPTGRKALELLVPRYFDRSDIFTCPCREDGDFSYEGFPVLIATTDVRSTRPIAWDKNPHPGGRRCVLLANLQVERVDEARFQELLVKAREPESRR